MHVLAVHVEELGVHVEDAVELEAADADDLLEGDARVLAPLDRRPPFAVDDAALACCLFGTKRARSVRAGARRERTISSCSPSRPEGRASTRVARLAQAWQ